MLPTAVFESRIERILARKEGNREIALFYEPECPEGGGWSIHLGNPSSWIGLGEISGELVASGKSLEEALSELERQLPASTK